MTDGPEKEMVARALVPGAIAAVVAFAAGFAAGGWDVAVSAGLGVAVVLANFAANGLSLAWAARISPTIVFAVGMAGFVIRLAIVAVIMVLLRQLAWFSTVAFIAGLVPTTIALLVMEMRMLAGRMTVDLWSFPAERREGTP